MARGAGAGPGERRRVREQKRTLRKEMRARLAAIPPAARADLSRSAMELLRARPEWGQARTVLGFLSTPDELDVRPAIHQALESGKNVGLPRYQPARDAYGAAEYRGEVLPPGRFGIPEPAARAPDLPLNRLDFVLVPGVAFDGFGGRLGRGKGFYDRLLAEIGGLKCGVAFDEQIVGQLPSEPHDIAMDFILTPTRWIAIRRSAD